MKKACLFVMASALVAGSATSAPPGHAFPEKALENYDVRGDKEKEGTSALADYRQKTAATTNTPTLAAARQFPATGRSNLLSRIPGLRVEDNPFGTAPEIVDVAGFLLENYNLR